ncbi:MAG: Na+/H+ antiporter subunit E [Hyphomicrobium sp.]|nr:Na+/H+ antiporter subunit E [Hyphomicrobium sp.]PPD09324.1 MAG: Na+/H+ antiporter subunit E [Hyphomicrobium sp.]
MTLRDWVLPQPFLTLSIAALWALLSADVSGGTLLLGLTLGIAIPLFTSQFWPGRPHTFRIGAALRLMLVVFYDIIVANFAVARIVLGNVDGIKSKFVDVPLDTNDPYVATILASIITLTPGTLSIDVDMDKRMVHIHGLDVPDRSLLIDEIKTRYEAPLKEIFGC